MILYLDALVVKVKQLGARYPMIVRSWRGNWARVIPFFQFPEEIRRVIYTTNAIESLNYSLRKIITLHINGLRMASDSK